VSSLMTDAVAEALAQKVTEKVMEQLRHQWGAVITELAKTHESNQRLTGKITQLEILFHKEEQNTQKLVQHAVTELKLNRETRLKAAETLRYAMKDLGLTE